MCKRQRENDAFTAFLNNLNISNQSYLNELFSCSKCERITANGKILFDGIAIDGMDMGILRSF